MALFENVCQQFPFGFTRNRILKKKKMLIHDRVTAAQSLSILYGAMIFHFSDYSSSNQSEMFSVGAKKSQTWPFSIV